MEVEGLKPGCERLTSQTYPQAVDKLMTPYFADESVTLWLGDALDVLSQLPDESVDCAVSSPPYYGLRDYGEPGQYGLEPSPAEYVERMRQVFAQVRRVLAKDGTCWLNLGDSYATSPPGNKDGHGANSMFRGTKLHGNQLGGGRTGGLPAKNLLGIPWRVAFALQDDGWILRNAIVWDKPNAMPESVTDRCSTTYELMFMLTRSLRYFFDLDAIREPHSEDRHGGSDANTAKAGLASAVLRGSSVDHQHRGLTRPFAETKNPLGRNPGDVWTIPTQPFPAAHFAVMAPELARRAIIAGCKPGGVVLDPFCGSGTTGMVAAQHGRRFVGIDLSKAYLELALRTRLRQTALIEETA